MTQAELLNDYRKINKLIEGTLRSIENDFKEQLKETLTWRTTQ